MVDLRALQGGSLVTWADLSALPGLGFVQTSPCRPLMEIEIQQEQESEPYKKAHLCLEAQRPRRDPLHPAFLPVSRCPGEADRIVLSGTCTPASEDPCPMSARFPWHHALLMCAERYYDAAFTSPPADPVHNWNRFQRSRSRREGANLNPRLLRSDRNRSGVCDRAAVAHVRRHRQVACRLHFKRPGIHKAVAGSQAGPERYRVRVHDELRV